MDLLTYQGFPSQQLVLFSLPTVNISGVLPTGLALYSVPGKLDLWLSGSLQLSLGRGLNNEWSLCMSDSDSCYEE